MTLVVRGISLNEEPISRPLIGRFDERGGTLGRSDEATLTLPDPERLISRMQANILHGDGNYWLENASAATPILHNGRALSTGMRVILHDGDEIRVGGYVLQTAFENDDASATILRGRTVVPGLRNLAPVSKAATAPAASAPQSPTPKQPPVQPLSMAATLAEPLSSGTGAAFAEMAANARQAGAGAQGSGSGDALWRGFLEGAGIDLPLPGGPSPKLLQSIGEMLKIAVGGIQSLVTMRARAKNEMQAEMTMIRARDNNPLKFSPDSALALQMILQPAARGFLSGPEALRDALTDLQSHQVGMTAGMRSVLEAVLERLDPAKIEALPSERSLLDRVNPTRRDARLWELYVQQYRALREEARDNFERYFGEALREAYEAQVRSLDSATDPPKGPKAGGR